MNVPGSSCQIPMFYDSDRDDYIARLDAAKPHYRTAGEYVLHDDGYLFLRT